MKSQTLNIGYWWSVLFYGELSFGWYGNGLLSTVTGVPVFFLEGISVCINSHLDWIADEISSSFSAMDLETYAVLPGHESFTLRSIDKRQPRSFAVVGVLYWR